MIKSYECLMSTILDDLPDLRIFYSVSLSNLSRLKEQNIARGMKP